MREAHNASGKRRMTVTHIQTRGANYTNRLELMDSNKGDTEK